MIKTEPWTGGVDEEYETQHFGFGSQRLKIAMRQMVEKNIFNGLKEMESFLQNSLQLNDTDKATLTHSCDKLMRLYCEKAGPSLDVIDREIERIMKVPSNVLLVGDETQLEQISDTEYDKLKDEVASLRKRVERGALMEALLTAEEKELSSVKHVCETAKKDMELFDLICEKSENKIVGILDETMLLCATVNIQEKKDFNVFNS